jgi:hypothetical protein
VPRARKFKLPVARNPKYRKTSCQFAQSKREWDMSYNRVGGDPPHSQKRDGKAEEKN